MPQTDRMMPDPAAGVKKTRRDSATETIASENRKLRNRLSQKAFRARQAVYIKELERRLQDATKPESQRNVDLEDRNKFYRRQLLDSHKKLESLQVSLQGVLDGVGGALGLNNASTSFQQSNEDASRGRGASSSCSDTTPQLADPFTVNTTPLNDFDEMFMYQDESSQALEPVIQQGYELDDCMLNHVDTINNVGPGTAMSSNMLLYNNRDVRMPPSLPYKSTDMGHVAHKNLLGREPILMDSVDGTLHRTNSVLSDHINVIEHLVRQKAKTSGALLSNPNTDLTTSISFMFSIFVSISWSPMIAFYTYTRAHVESNMFTAWKLNLTGNPRFDDIITEVGDAYVVEGNLANLVVGYGNVPCYIRIWDLVRAISPADTSKFPFTSHPTPAFWDPFNIEASPVTSIRTNPTSTIKDVVISPKSVSCLPVMSVDALFSSSSLALAVFKHLGGDSGTLEFKFDPEFYVRHPELYDHREKPVANGVLLRPIERERFPAAGPLNKEALQRYAEAIEWAGIGMGRAGHGADTHARGSI